MAQRKWTGAALALAVMAMLICAATTVNCNARAPLDELNCSPTT